MVFKEVSASATRHSCIAVLQNLLPSKCPKGFPGWLNAFLINQNFKVIWTEILGIINMHIWMSPSGELSTLNLILLTLFTVLCLIVLCLPALHFKAHVLNQSYIHNDTYMIILKLYLSIFFYKVVKIKIMASFLK